MHRRSLRGELLAVSAITIAIISMVVLTGSGLIWVDVVWARRFDQPRLLTSISGLYYLASLALAFLLFVAGLAHWDNDWWARWAFCAYCVGTLVLHCALCFAGNFLAPDDPNWTGVIPLLGLAVQSIYPLIILALVLLKKL